MEMYLFTLTSQRPEVTRNNSVMIFHQIQIPFISLLVVIVSAQLSTASIAGNYLSPDEIEGSIKIDAESLIQLARDHDDLVIIDSRISSDRRQGFIAGSISLPDTETGCLSLLPLIDNKATATVFYCNGPKCRRSDRAIVIANECGYTNLYWFRGGFEEWQNKQYLISK
jgi:rhodanese-related sulfurtransferase